MQEFELQERGGIDAMSPPGDTVVFKGPKIDSRRIKREIVPETGLASAVDGFLSGPLEGAPEEAASKFLHANYNLFTPQRSTLRELQVEQVSRSPAGYHVTFQQVHQGVPVEGAKVSVHMTIDQRVHAAYSRLKPEVAGLDVQEMAKNGIDQAEAIQIALASIRAAVKLAGPARAEQVILTQETPRLTWKVLLSTMRPAQEWVVWVDAQSGEVLQRREISMG